MFFGISSSLSAEDVFARPIIAVVSKSKLVAEGVSPEVFEQVPVLDLSISKRIFDVQVASHSMGFVSHHLIF